jgi:flagellar protein FliO/FliZ
VSLIGSLFGEGAASFWTVVLALAFVLVLIVFLVWVLKFVLSASRTVGLGRNRRIGVTDTIPVDAKRHLILVRRDDVEHLILTGGTNDLIVEAAIPLKDPGDDKPARSPAAIRRSGLSLSTLTRERGAPPGLDQKPPDANPATEKSRRIGLPLAPGLRRREPEPAPLPPVAAPPVAAPPAKPVPTPAAGPDQSAPGHPGTGMSALEKLREMARGRTATGTSNAKGTTPGAPRPSRAGAAGVLRPVTRHQAAPQPVASNNSGNKTPDSDMSGRNAPVHRQDIQSVVSGRPRSDPTSKSGPVPGPATQSAGANSGPSAPADGPAPAMPDPADWQSVGQPPTHGTDAKTGTDTKTGPDTKARQ